MFIAFSLHQYCSDIAKSIHFIVRNFSKKKHRVVSVHYVVTGAHQRIDILAMSSKFYFNESNRHKNRFDYP